MRCAMIIFSHEQIHELKEFINHFATKRAWDLKNTKNDVFLGLNLLKLFRYERKCDRYFRCILSYEGYKSTIRQRWATLGGPQVGEIAKKPFLAQLAQSLNIGRNMS